MDEAAIQTRLRAAVRDVPDFPRQGILFKDITTLLLDAEAFRIAVGALCQPYRSKPPSRILGIESRGFLFGAAMAYELSCGLIVARKPGKLPVETERVTYELEYGQDALEVHRDAINPGEQVLVVDDLIATGGTARSAMELIQRLGGEVLGAAFLIELTELGGRRQLDGHRIHSILRY